MIEADEMAGRKAAVDARNDDDFLIIARTDALATDGFEAAFERAAPYTAAGAKAKFDSSGQRY